MPRTVEPDALTHGEELLTGMMARQILLLGHIRALLLLLIVLPIVGGLIALAVTSTGPVGSWLNGG